jgi:hypothetical protein
MRAIDNRRSPREIGQDIYRVIADVKAPRLGVVAIGCKLRLSIPTSPGQDVVPGGAAR